MTRGLVALFVLLGCVTACGSGEVPSELRTRATEATTTTTAAPSTTTTTLPPQPVTFAFAGDVHFEGVLRGQLADDPAGLLAPIAPVLEQADLAVANLETAVTERGTAAPKAYTFRAPSTAFTALASAGVDVVNLANNHGVDYGPDGLADTLFAAGASQMPLVGAGTDTTAAYTPYRTEIAGQRIAVFGATQVLDSNLIDAWTATDSSSGLAYALPADQLVAAVTAARPDTDTLVVFLHWGTEGETCPTDRQTELADQLVAAGADIVVGSHAHRLQGGGRMGEALVDYGLGNFVFYAPDGSAGAATGVLLVTATGRTIDSYEWVPATIRSGVPTPLEGEEAAQAQADWAALRDCAGLSP